MASNPPRPQPVSIVGILDALPDAPVASTRDRQWTGVTMDVHEFLPAYAFSAPGHDHHLVCYAPSGSGRLVQTRAGSTHDSLITAGTSLIMPSGYESSWDGAATRSARIRVPMPLLRSAAEQAGTRSVAQFELRNVFETRDATIERIALIMIDELEREPHPMQALVVDTLSYALAGHLLRGYNGYAFPGTPGALPLGPRQLERLREYVEARIDQPIGLDELARLVDVSKFHFVRIFKRSTGMTPIQYVEERRIERAKALLRRGGISLAEVALRAGFADQSHFTRRFARHVGCTPGAFSRTYRPGASGRGEAGSGH